MSETHSQEDHPKNFIFFQNKESKSKKNRKAIPVTGLGGL
jgi:hypothetical protein